VRTVPLVVAILFWVAASEAQLAIHVAAGRNSAAIPYVNHGEELLTKGDYAAALQNFEKALQIDPTMWPAYYARAHVFVIQHKWDLALRDLNAAIQFKGNFAPLFTQRSMVNQHFGNYWPSLRDANKAVRVAPDAKQQSIAFNGRAWLRATSLDPETRNGNQAVADAKRACAGNGGMNGGFLDTLAAAYAEAGDFNSAISYEARALKIDHFGTSDQEVGARRRLALYKQHQPYRERP
jgi:tetratricopeptide (TPR) repeat protein